MTLDEKVKLWDAINTYVTTCGGDPAKHVYGNIKRMQAVVDVENIVVEVEERVAAEVEDECEG